MGSTGLTRIGHYQLESPVARGGMGEIWRAVDDRTGEVVAIKRLLLDRGDELFEVCRRRLLREARAVVGLKHPNIVRGLDSGLDEEGQPYLVLEWLDGEDLAARNRRSRLSLATSLQVVRQALEGLSYCHEAGVVHRDLKPANLFLVGDSDDPSVKLVDFGLALLDGDITRLTQAGEVMGTLYYMSPEQARGTTQDHRSDIYSMGVMLYELCTGRLPFTGEKVVAVLLKIITETPPPPRQIQPELPDWLEQSIVAAMSRAPSDRFASASRMRTALDQPETLPIIEQLAVDVHADTAAPRPTASQEYRLVSMLCVQPVDRGQLPPHLEGHVERLGGLPVHLLGRRMVGMFGLEKSLGDEALRAVQAGLVVQQDTGRDARMLVATVHIEVRAGLQLDSKDLDATMDRLPDLPAGEVVLDGPTRDLVSRHVELKRVGTHDAVLALASGEPSRQRVLGRETPAVGREAELAALRAAFYRSADNAEPEAVVIVGPAGVGKSRLRQELLPELRERSALCLEARAESTRTQTPFGLIGSAVVRQAGIHLGQSDSERRAALTSFVSGSDAAAEIVPFIAEVVGVEIEQDTVLRVARDDPKVMRERILSAFETLIRAVGQRQPVVLNLDDVQWADDETLDLCEALMERLEDVPLFVVLTGRPDLDERRPTLLDQMDPMRIDLKELGRRPLKRLVQGMLGDKVGTEVQDLVTSWSAGNPFLAEELVCWLLAKEALVLRPSGWEILGDVAALELPVGVEGAIQARLDQLPPECKELLKTAAVFGMVFWEDGCRAMGFADPLPLLRRIEATEFIQPARESRVAGTREWAFRHVLLCQVSYNMLPPAARKPLHMAAARWLEEVGEPDAGLLAMHFGRGGDTARAADYQARAGARAYIDGDLNQAVACFEAALVDNLPLSARLDRTLGMVKALIFLGRFDEARQRTDGLLEGCLDTRRSEVLYAKARIEFSVGYHADAEEVLRQALEAEHHSADLGFNIHHTLFWVIWVQGRYGDAAELARQLGAMARAAELPDQLCAANMALAYANVVRGDLSRSVALSREAVAQAREVGHPYREVDALTLLGATLELVGQFDEASRSLKEALGVARRLKTAFHQASIEVCLGRICAHHGEVARAIEHADSTMQLAQDLGDQRSLVLGLLVKVNALVASEDKKAAPVALENAKRAASLAEALPLACESRMTLARVYLALGNTSEALHHAEAAAEALDILGTQERCEVDVLVTLYDAMVANGRSDATDALTRAWQMLSTRQDRISDPVIRESHAQVPVNARVATLMGEFEKG